MPPSSPIQEFVERAKAAGTTDESIAGILKARGWPEKEVYEALALHYERATGSAIPQRVSGGTAARDAFFYLVIFSTLATWMIGLGSLAFTLIDQWFSDTLFPNTYGTYDIYSMANSLACIIVAFPIYLLVSWIVLRQTRLHPERLTSPVRRWLTYMALVTAAGIFVGDLIDVLTTFLRGQVTSRFLADAFVVLVLSGAVFFYYFGGLRKSEDSAAEPKRNWHAPMAALSAAVVILMLILGFSHFGGPAKQRLERADATRLHDLYALSLRIRGHWSGSGTPRQLPQSLSELGPDVPTDPVTHQPYNYQPSQGTNYELCSVFALPSGQNQGQSRDAEWTHPAGFYCFQLDAARVAGSPNVNIY